MSAKLFVCGYGSGSEITTGSECVVILVPCEEETVLVGFGVSMRFLDFYQTEISLFQQVKLFCLLLCDGIEVFQVS